MNESSISIFIVQAALALFTFFVAAPCVLNAISTFTVQARLAKALVEEGVITEADRRLLQPKKQIAGVVISVILVGALVAVAARTAPYGFFSCGIAAIAGVLKYRRILEFNSLTVSRFKNTYQSVMNNNKYDQYVKKMF